VRGQFLYIFFAYGESWRDNVHSIYVIELVFHSSFSTSLEHTERYPLVAICSTSFLVGFVHFCVVDFF
jgi:hypothetical protein